MSPSTRLALATYRALPDLSPDDRLLIEPLRRLGVEACAVVWDDSTVDWSTFTGVVLRSCWDYHLRHDEFLAWVERLAALGVRVWNPPSIVRWNSDKKYLADLSRAGVSTVPTRFLARRTAARVSAVLREEGWSEAVVKPAVSASAHETWRMSARDADAHQPRFETLLARGDVLVQPYVREVAEHGEWSLVFLGGDFSHAVLKRPAAGDFRVQTEHGGRFEPTAAPEPLVRSAARVLDATQARDSILYARVDGYEDSSGALVLMELELIEPLLFLAEHPPAAERLAQEIASRAACDPRDSRSDNRSSISPGDCRSTRS